MNAFQIEKLSVSLKSLIHSKSSALYKLNSIIDFFEIILSQENSLIFEAFFTEYYDYYIDALQNFNAIGVKPDISDRVQINVKKILEKNIGEKKKQKLREILKIIESQYYQVHASLNGKIISEEENKITFPVIVSSNNPNDNYGQLESFSVKIHKTKNIEKDNFIIVPSNQKIDKVFKEQIEVSWKLALNFLKKHYKKSNEFHEIIIVFSHRYLNIVGYSLGVSITLGFIQELFKFYNTPLSLSLKGNTTFTGGLSENSKIKPVGNDITKQKIETVFYSPINYFGVPAQDFSNAKVELDKLKEKYPRRQLKLFNIEDFSDVINHRQIISIEKAKIKDRTVKFARQNSITLFLLTILLVISGVYFTFLTDNNPYEIEFVHNTANILSKRGKVLWSSKINAPGEEQFTNKIYDVDNDGVNEVLLSNEIFSVKDSTRGGRIACFNNKKELIWQYYFRDSISTQNYSYDNFRFYSALIDITEENGIPVLLATTRHLYFPSAIFKLDARTGERLDGTLWSQGHLRKGVVGDFNNDGNTEIFIGGVNNSMESAFALLIDYNKIKGTSQTPNLAKNLFGNIPIANCNQYFLFSKTDLCNFLQYRLNINDGAYFDFISNEYLVNTREGKINFPIGLIYRFNKNFTKVSLQIGDDIQFIRDSLVINSKLNGPLTNDPLFSEQTIKGIKRWDGQKFVGFYEK